jgi:single-strand DNA-binding protein
MDHLNSIILEGNLIKPLVFTKTEKGVPIGTFSIAASRFYKADDKVEEEISHFEIKAYGNLAKNISEHADVGRGLRVVGRLKQEKSTDSEGIQRSKVVIIAEHIEFKPLLPGANNEN